MIFQNTIDIQLQDSSKVLLTSERPIFEDLIKCKTKVSLKQLIDLLHSLQLLNVEDNFVPFIPKCSDCGGIFSRNSELIMHFKTSHKKDNFEVVKEDDSLNDSRNESDSLSNELVQDELIKHIRTPPKKEGQGEGPWLNNSRNDSDNSDVKEMEHESVLEAEDNISIQQQDWLKIERESIKDKPDAKEELEKRKIHICHECGKKYTETQYLRKHIEIVHNGIRYTCEHCKGKFKSPTYLQEHIEGVHLGQTFNCDKCDYKASHKEMLKIHKRSKHQGILFFCDQCEFKTSHRSCLTMHKKAKHGDVRLQCNQCDYNTSYSTRHRLYYHNDTKHNTKKFLCNQCDFVANVRAKLIYHVKTKHS